ncbi:hypothetical protein GCM10022247_20480 [Allokutzneria multivorans]|uniref:Uncharacterized protein n=1 Tax=Allokutzneria multivorans TaxID=1142134 RepID=A0ABP7RNQ4_9PSEU
MWHSLRGLPLDGVVVANGVPTTSGGGSRASATEEVWIRSSPCRRLPDLRPGGAVANSPVLSM